ncbi:MAG: putative toxin-antitoxin system toxin component, PIN family [Wenzhouxiangellaceae bacterium]
MRVVLDTNVVISALLWRSTPYRLLEAIRRHESVTLYSSPVLLEELADVIARPALSRRLAAIGKTAREILADYLEAIELIEPVTVPRIARDPDDDHVLACALAATAELTVSGDQDLLEIADYEGTSIVTPAEALRRIEKK